MEPGDPRWVEVTPSQFPHEAEGLRLVRELLGEYRPVPAWSNFEFRDAHGKWHEVDLLVLGRRRLHLVELKYYAGTLTGDDYRWRRDQRATEDSPLKLARRKAQRLASKLQDSLRAVAREKPGLKIPDAREVVPFVQEAVFLHHPGLRCALPAASRADLFGLDHHEPDMGVPGISRQLLEGPTDREAVPPRRDELIVKLMARIGVVARRQREAGSWILDEEPLAEGEGWPDWPALHRVASTDRARIRFFVTAPGAAAEQRTRIRRLAEHEFQVISRLAHDGVASPRDVVDAELGIGLVYPDDQRYRWLERWLADHRGGVLVATLLGVLRQVAEAVGYAHRHRVVHRGADPAGGVGAGQRRGADPRVGGRLAVRRLAARRAGQQRATLRGHAAGRGILDRRA